MLGELSMADTGKKTLYDIDLHVWKKFGVYCKDKEINMGIKLSDILKKYLNKEGYL